MQSGLGPIKVSCGCFGFDDLMIVWLVLLPFGCDFTFQNAHMVYKNVDRLIEYINAHTKELGATVRYSTPTEYLRAVQEQYQGDWPVVENDFFPYADGNASYWSGFYTSRYEVFTEPQCHSPCGLDLLRSITFAWLTLDLVLLILFLFFQMHCTYSSHLQ